MPDRRAFLTFLAGSPLLAAFPRCRCAAAAPHSRAGLEQAAHALDVFDFEAAAQKLVPPAHWGYLMSGVDGEATLRANRDGFDRYQLRARRFVDVSKIDLSVTLFGQTYSSPIALCPIGSAGAFHADGEKAPRAAAQDAQSAADDVHAGHRSPSRTSARHVAGRSGFSSTRPAAST